VFSPELFDIEKGIVSGNKPGGGFSPILMRPRDGFRLVAVKDKGMNTKIKENELEQ